MTAPDVRTAARDEFKRKNWPTNRDDYWSREQAFVAGAVYGAALVTPTREQIAEGFWTATPLGKVFTWEAMPENDKTNWLAAADAVLALMRSS